MIDVAEGADLLAAVAEAGDVAGGFGTVEGVELRVAGEATEVVRAVRGRLTLCHLVARGGEAYVVLSRASDVGLDTVAGKLVRARSLGVTLVPAAPLAKPAPAAAAVADEAPKRREAPLGKLADGLAHAAASWADVAEESAAEEERADEPEADEGDDEIRAGDLVDHFSFGLCDVLMSDGERLKIRDKHGPGRIREVAVEMLEVTRAPGREGKRCFRLMKRR